jgi:putative Mg2+ transporter-C (MgtC) family protein
MTPEWEYALRLVLAGLVGALIGWEREVRGKPAGLRTLMLVSLSAAVYVAAAEQAALRRGEAVDAGRLMSGIAQGIGFLGAGAILQARGEVRWLTTAASLWAAAALGMAIGLGMYSIALVGAFLVFATLKWVALIEDRWMRKGADKLKTQENEKKPDES